MARGVMLDLKGADFLVCATFAGFLRPQGTQGKYRVEGYIWQRGMPYLHERGRKVVWMHWQCVWP